MGRPLILLPRRGSCATENAKRKGSKLWICRWPQNLVLAASAAIASHLVVERSYLRLKDRQKTGHERKLTLRERGGRTSCPIKFPVTLCRRQRTIAARIEAMSIAPSMQAPDSVTPGCEAHLISDAAHLENLERVGRRLFDVAPTASPPLRWEWVRKWWRIYGPVHCNRGRGLRLITVGRR